MTRSCRRGQHAAGTFTLAILLIHSSRTIRYFGVTPFQFLSYMVNMLFQVGYLCIPSTYGPTNYYVQNRREISIRAWSEKSARLAQSVEHQTFNLRVEGSSPSLGAIFFCECNCFQSWFRHFQSQGKFERTHENSLLRVGRCRRGSSACMKDGSNETHTIIKVISLRAGFEPAREDPIGFQVQRLNHSAIAAPPRGTSLSIRWLAGCKLSYPR